jgi:hypothetical protein
LEELVGSLMTHEITMKGHEEESPKRRSIALKSSVVEVEEDNDESGDEDIALMTRNFRNFLKRKQARKNFKDFKREEPKKEYSKVDNKKDHITCYKCKKPGHNKADCPLLKYKKKAMKATWEDSDSSSSSEEDEGEIANMCFRELEDDEVYLSDLEDSKPSYDELENVFDELTLHLKSLDSNTMF